VTGIVYCAVVEACQEKFDVARAREWTGALSSWCDNQPGLVPFRGSCLIHRSEILALDGDWPAAVAQAELARDLLSDPPGQPPLGAAYYQLGQLDRLGGDLEGAEAAYRMASQHGREPQPGLALLRLAQGHADAAAEAYRLHSENPALRARALARRAEVLAGPLKQPALAVAELEAVQNGTARLTPLDDYLVGMTLATLYETSLHDRGKAMGELRRLLDRYPDTRQARFLRVRLANLRDAHFDTAPQ
jgi:tetratricopeptide (TPR) repeat protein